ncbi:MAG: L-rhamnose catabolism isomerase [Flavisolibacter sp.]
MQITREQLNEANERLYKEHQPKLRFILEQHPLADSIIKKLSSFQLAIPSWALGTGATRFGRFAAGGEPRNLEEKLEDVALLHQITGSCNSISLHIPWDIPKQTIDLKNMANQLGLRFDAMNSNTFQDQKGQPLSYKFGSFQHVKKAVRQQAIDHNLEVIAYGKQLGSTSLNLWLADGSNFPGQLNFREAFLNTLEGLRSVYEALPNGWQMFIEYKAFEPNFYSMTVGDWGQSLLYCSKLGPKANCLVDLGHHLANANIEQIVSLLLMENRLGGFHFNDSKYGDDDLTAGSVKPYQLFLIFNELVEGMNEKAQPAWMIDASHNVKDPLEDLLQSIEAIKIAYAQSLLIDRNKLDQYRQDNDVVMAQSILQDAFRTDVRPLIAEAQLRSHASLDPILFYRQGKIRNRLIKERGNVHFATGL